MSPYVSEGLVRSPNPVIVGAYSPFGDPPFDGVRRALLREGEAELHREGPLIAGRAWARSAAAPQADTHEDREVPAVAGRMVGRGSDHTPVLVLLDGHLNNGVSEAQLGQRWRREGEGTLDTLRGAFALLLWDRERHRGMIVRDQVGERTMLLARQGGILFFATELRALLNALPRRPSPDAVTVSARLAFADLGENRTLYEGITRLEPGHLLELSPDGQTQRPYWTPRYRGVLQGSRRELLELLRDTVAGSTRSAIGPAEQVGLLLSGGIDSSTVAACAVQSANTRLWGYSASFPRHPDVDETELVDELAAANQIPVTRVLVRSGSVLAASLRYLADWQAPDHSSTGFFWRPLLSRAATDGMEVLLDGEGGDERFTTPYYLLADLLAAGRLRAARDLIESFPNIARDPSRQTRLRLLRQVGIGPLLPPVLIAARRRLRSREGLLQARTARAARAAGDPWGWKRLEGPRWWTQLAHQLTLAGRHHGGEEHFVRLARGAGLRQRHPLLSLELLELILRFPPELAFDPQITRPHIRRAMAGLIPDSIRLRPAKSYFNQVRDDSLFGSDLSVVRDLVADPRAETRAFLRTPAVAELLRFRPTSSLSIEGGTLLQVVQIECFLRLQHDPQLADRLLPRLEEAKLEFDPA